MLKSHTIFPQFERHRCLLSKVKVKDMSALVTQLYEFLTYGRLITNSKLNFAV